MNVLGSGQIHAATKNYRNAYLLAGVRKLFCDLLMTSSRASHTRIKPLFHSRQLLLSCHGTVIKSYKGWVNVSFPARKEIRYIPRLKKGNSSNFKFQDLVKVKAIHKTGPLFLFWITRNEDHTSLFKVKVPFLKIKG